MAASSYTAEFGAGVVVNGLDLNTDATKVLVGGRKGRWFVLSSLFCYCMCVCYYIFVDIFTLVSVNSRIVLEFVQSFVSVFCSVFWFIFTL